MNYTDELPDWVICSCGTKGPHESIQGCPQEGMMLWSGDVLDDTIMRVRYEDDLVVMALLDHVRDLVWSTRASHVVLIYQQALFERERKMTDAEIARAIRTQADAQKRIDLLQGKIDELETNASIARLDKEEAKRLNQDTQKRMLQMAEKEAGWRAVLEKLAVATGFFTDKENAYGWSPDALLREAVIDRLREKAGG